MTQLLDTNFLPTTKLLELCINVFKAQCAAEDEGFYKDELCILMVSELIQFVYEH